MFSVPPAHVLAYPFIPSPSSVARRMENTIIKLVFLYNYRYEYDGHEEDHLGMDITITARNGQLWPTNGVHGV